MVITKVTIYMVCKLKINREIRKICRDHRRKKSHKKTAAQVPAILFMYYALQRRFVFGVQPFHFFRSDLFVFDIRQTHLRGSSACINQMLRMKDWRTVFRAQEAKRGGVRQRHSTL